MSGSPWYTDEQKATIRALKREGHTSREIADLLQCSLATASRYSQETVARPHIAARPNVFADCAAKITNGR